MFVREVFPGILIAVLSLLFVECSAQHQNVTYITKSELRNVSLQCYDCNSEYDPRCGDPFNPYSIGIVNCSELIFPEHLRNQRESKKVPKPAVCRKLVQKIEGRTRVIRECGYVQNNHYDDNKQCAIRTGTKEVQVHYCSCTKSLCNSSPNGIRPFSFGVALSLFVTLVYKSIA